MSEEEIEKTISSFLPGFNAMCKAENKNIIIREYTTNYESGPKTVTKRYEVNYVFKKARKGWKIYAQSNGFWIFKKRFPLVSIVMRKDGLALEGLYVKGISTFPASELKEKLEEYTEICKKLARDIFVNS